MYAGPSPRPQTSSTKYEVTADKTMTSDFQVGQINGNNSVKVIQQFTLEEGKFYGKFATHRTAWNEGNRNASNVVAAEIRGNVPDGTCCCMENSSITVTCTFDSQAGLPLLEPSIIARISKLLNPCDPDYQLGGEETLLEEVEPLLKHMFMYLLTLNPRLAKKTRGTDGPYANNNSIRTTNQLAMDEHTYSGKFISERMDSARVNLSAIEANIQGDFEITHGRGHDQIRIAYDFDPLGVVPAVTIETAARNLLDILDAGGEHYQDGREESLMSEVKPILVQIFNYLLTLNPRIADKISRLHLTNHQLMSRRTSTGLESFPNTTILQSEGRPCAKPLSDDGETLELHSDGHDLTTPVLMNVPQYSTQCSTVSTSASIVDSDTCFPNALANDSTTKNPTKNAKYATHVLETALSNIWNTGCPVKEPQKVKFRFPAGISFSKTMTQSEVTSLLRKRLKMLSKGVETLIDFSDGSGVTTQEVSAEVARRELSSALETIKAAKRTPQFANLSTVQEGAICDSFQLNIQVAESHLRISSELFATPMEQSSEDGHEYSIVSTTQEDGPDHGMRVNDATAAIKTAKAENDNNEKSPQPTPGHAAAAALQSASQSSEKPPHMICRTPLVQVTVEAPSVENREDEDEVSFLSTLSSCGSKTSRLIAKSPTATANCVEALPVARMLAKTDSRGMGNEQSATDALQDASECKSSEYKGEGMEQLGTYRLMSLKIVADLLSSVQDKLNHETVPETLNMAVTDHLLDNTGNLEERHVEEDSRSIDPGLENSELRMPVADSQKLRSTMVVEEGLTSAPGKLESENYLQQRVHEGARLSISEKDTKKQEAAKLSDQSSVETRNTALEMRVTPQDYESYTNIRRDDTSTQSRELSTPSLNSGHPMVEGLSSVQRSGECNTLVENVLLDVEDAPKHIEQRTTTLQDQAPEESAEPSQTMSIFEQALTSTQNKLEEKVIVQGPKVVEAVDLPLLNEVLEKALISTQENIGQGAEGQGSLQHDETPHNEQQQYSDEPNKGNPEGERESTTIPEVALEPCEVHLKAILTNEDNEFAEETKTSVQVSQSRSTVAKGLTSTTLKLTQDSRVNRNEENQRPPMTDVPLEKELVEKALTSALENLANKHIQKTGLHEVESRNHDEIPHNGQQVSEESGPRTLEIERASHYSPQITLDVAREQDEALVEQLIKNVDSKLEKQTGELDELSQAQVIVKTVLNSIQNKLENETAFLLRNSQRSSLRDLPFEEKTVEKSPASAEKRLASECVENRGLHEVKDQESLPYEHKCLEGSEKEYPEDQMESRNVSGVSEGLTQLKLLLQPLGNACDVEIKELEEQSLARSLVDKVLNSTQNKLCEEQEEGTMRKSKSQSPAAKYEQNVPLQKALVEKALASARERLATECIHKKGLSITEKDIKKLEILRRCDGCVEELQNTEKTNSRQASETQEVQMINPESADSARTDVSTRNGPKNVSSRNADERIEKDSTQLQNTDPLRDTQKAAEDMEPAIFGRFLIRVEDKKQTEEEGAGNMKPHSSSDSFGFHEDFITGFREQRNAPRQTSQEKSKIDEEKAMDACSPKALDSVTEAPRPHDDSLLQHPLQTVEEETGRGVELIVVAAEALAVAQYRLEAELQPEANEEMVETIQASKEPREPRNEQLDQKPMENAIPIIDMQQHCDESDFGVGENEAGPGLPFGGPLSQEWMDAKLFVAEITANALTRWSEEINYRQWATDSNAPITIPSVKLLPVAPAADCGKQTFQHARAESLKTPSKTPSNDVGDGELPSTQVINLMEDDDETKDEGSVSHLFQMDNCSPSVTPEILECNSTASRSMKFDVKVDTSKGVKCSLKTPKETVQNDKIVLNLTAARGKATIVAQYKGHSPSTQTKNQNASPTRCNAVSKAQGEHLRDLEDISEITLGENGPPRCNAQRSPLRKANKPSTPKKIKFRTGLLSHGNGYTSDLLARLTAPGGAKGPSTQRKRPTGFKFGNNNNCLAPDCRGLEPRIGMHNNSNTVDTYIRSPDCRCSPNRIKRFAAFCRKLEACLETKGLLGARVDPRSKYELPDPLMGKWTSCRCRSSSASTSGNRRRTRSEPRKQPIIFSPARNLFMPCSAVPQLPIVYPMPKPSRRCRNKLRKRVPTPNAGDNLCDSSLSPPVKPRRVRCKPVPKSRKKRLAKNPRKQDSSALSISDFHSLREEPTTSFGWCFNDSGPTSFTDTSTVKFGLDIRGSPRDVQIAFGVKTPTSGPPYQSVLSMELVKCDAVVREPSRPLERRSQASQHTNGSSESLWPPPGEVVVQIHGPRAPEKLRSIERHPAMRLADSTEANSTKENFFSLSISRQSPHMCTEGSVTPMPHAFQQFSLEGQITVQRSNDSCMQGPSRDHTEASKMNVDPAPSQTRIMSPITLTTNHAIKDLPGVAIGKSEATTLAPIVTPPVHSVSSRENLSGYMTGKKSIESKHEDNPPQGSWSSHLTEAPNIDPGTASPNASDANFLVSQDEGLKVTSEPMNSKSLGTREIGSSDCRTYTPATLTLTVTGLQSDPTLFGIDQISKEDHKEALLKENAPRTPKLPNHDFTHTTAGTTLSEYTTVLKSELVEPPTRPSAGKVDIACSTMDLIHPVGKDNSAFLTCSQRIKASSAPAHQEPHLKTSMTVPLCRQQTSMEPPITGSVVVPQTEVQPERNLTPVRFPPPQQIFSQPIIQQPLQHPLLQMALRPPPPFMIPCHQFSTAQNASTTMPYRVESPYQQTPQIILTPNSPSCSYSGLDAAMNMTPNSTICSQSYLPFVMSTPTCHARPVAGAGGMSPISSASQTGCGHINGSEAAPQWYCQRGQHLTPMWQCHHQNTHASSTIISPGTVQLDYNHLHSQPPPPPQQENIASVNVTICDTDSHQEQFMDGPKPTARERTKRLSSTEAVHQCLHTVASHGCMPFESYCGRASPSYKFGRISPLSPLHDPCQMNDTSFILNGRPYTLAIRYNNNSADRSNEEDERDYEVKEDAKKPTSMMRKTAAIRKEVEEDE